MRFTFIILLFFNLGADAQMIIKAHANYRPYAVAVAQNLLLDDYPNAAAAYSLRKLDKDYTGSAIRVRRSNDNSEQDIGFTSSGDLDTASLKTFVGANSGFITTWYDQSGNARNATQTTAANQPRIVNAGTINRESGKPLIQFIRSSTTFLTGAAIFDVNGFTLFCAIGTHSTASQQNFFGNRSANGGWIYRYNTTPQYQFNMVFFNAANINISSQNKQVVSFRKIPQQNTTFDFYINNINYASSTSILGTISNFTIGIQGPGTTANSLDGSIFEIVGYTFDNFTNRTGIQNNINTYYSIY
jgi:hypothetical protein